MTELTFDTLLDLARGRFGATDVACPLCGPDRQAPENRKRRVLRIWVADGFTSFNCARCGAHGYAHRQGSSPAMPAPSARSGAMRAVAGEDAEKRTRLALDIWNAAGPLFPRHSSSRAEPVPTLGWRYFTERRGLHIGLLDDLSHCALA
jgi:hypothetical protein